MSGAEISYYAELPAAISPPYAGATTEDAVALIDGREAMRVGPVFVGWAANRRLKRRASRGLSNRASNTSFLPVKSA